MKLKSILVIASSTQVQEAAELGGIDYQQKYLMHRVKANLAWLRGRSLRDTCLLDSVLAE